MTSRERWMRSTVDFMFRAVGVALLLGIAEIWTDFDWPMILAGFGVWWFFFCCFHTPLGYKRQADGTILERADDLEPGKAEF